MHLVMISSGMTSVTGTLSWLNSRLYRSPEKPRERKVAQNIPGSLVPRRHS